MAASSGLRHLEVVSVLACNAAAAGDALYRRARACVPAPAEALVSRVEDAAAAIAAPLLALAQSRAADLLAAADAKVDALLAATSAKHSEGMGALGSAKAGAFGLIAGAVNALKAAADPAAYVAKAAALAQRALDAAVPFTDPDRVVAAAAAAAGAVAARPPVSQALAMADPLITVGQEQYSKAHGMIVMQPLYKVIYDTASSLPAKAKDTSLYRKGYPLVAPVADPVISNFTKSKVIKQLDEHLKPKVA